MNRLTVANSRLQPVMGAIAGVIMVPLGLASLVGGVTRGFAPMPIVLGVMLLGMFGVVVAIVRRGGARSVRYFSDEGLERGDGKRLAWSDLERVVNQVRRSPAGKRWLWRTEIRFRGGQSAWLLPLRVRNFDEVRDFVRTLPCEHTEVNV